MAWEDLQGLLSEFTQSSRLLRLTTPLGPHTLLAECVRAEESVGSGFRLAISALSTEANLALKSLMGQPALLQLLTAHGHAPLRPFHGHITAAENSGANGGLARYHITLGPWTEFARLGRDSRIFQNKTVFDIIAAICRQYHGKGRLNPQWRFDIRDSALYPIRSLTTQYQESDFSFIERLILEEGLFYYFEHMGDLDSPTLGCHCMVIADHNGSFKPHAQAGIRFTQSSAVMKEDGIDRWTTSAVQRTNAVDLSSWNYRTRANMTASAGTQAATLTAHESLGPYASESRAQAQRLADLLLEGVAARKTIHTAAGTVRTVSAGSTFTFHGHARSGGDDGAFVAIRTVHLMHNNLSAQLRASIDGRLPSSALAGIIAGETSGLDGERPLYRNRIDAIPLSTPYRACAFDLHGRARLQKPTVHGQQTAIVVGPPGSAIHTDRDHRIKVQFHWQRGSQSHGRLDHPDASHDGAPADDNAGAWVRVATTLAAMAGANWGGHALPRVGQEVVIDFLEGDIDRPVVIGTVYNGRGREDDQYNELVQGGGASTGNAPAWFPGVAGAHAHPAVLSGIKSQSLSTSQAGAGACNELVFDDTAGQSSIALQRLSSAQKSSDALILGYLRHRADNQRLPSTGFGAELKTDAGAALRAGKGMLLTSHARPATCNQLDVQEGQSQLQHSAELQKRLATDAVRHAATLDGAGDTELPALRQMMESIAALEHGDDGNVTAFGQPQLQLAAAAGIVAATPAPAVVSAAGTSSMTAGEDINQVAQGQYAHLVRGGINMFTKGTVLSSDKPNQECGIKLHAASGKVSVQSQSGLAQFTGGKGITVASITKGIRIAAKDNVLMTAMGAMLKLEGGDIMLHAPGKVSFNASMKTLCGPADGTFGAPELPAAKPIYDEQFIVRDEHSGMPLAHVAYRIVTGDGKEYTGLTDALGQTQRIHAASALGVKLLFD